MTKAEILLNKERKDGRAWATYKEICGAFLIEKDGYFESKKMNLKEISDTFKAVYEGNKNPACKVRHRVSTLVESGLLEKSSQTKAFYSLNIHEYFKALDTKRYKVVEV